VSDKHRTMVLLFLVLLVMAGTAGCSSQTETTEELQQQQSENNNQNNIENSDQNGANSDQVLADCFVNFYLTAWEDLNGDGVWDEDEPPLEGVEFRMIGNYAHSFAGGKGTSDKQGEASIDAWAPGGCPNPFDFNLQAQTPEGYRLTTAAEVIHDASSEQVGRYQFGFSPEE
jgi:uncharacterized protein YceK